MKRWTLDDIPWHQFDASKAAPELVSLAKAACMVEHNGDDYARYLCEVFSDDAEFQQVAKVWAEEEVQHGKVLRRWAELADPSFDFEQSFRTFTTGYKLPLNVQQSVRGSRCGELIARCVVETGTSSYYTALKEHTDEPVFKIICGKIAADEFRHYKLFYDYLNVYLTREKIGFFKRLAVAVGRVTESEDDELAYAFYASQPNPDNIPYHHKTYINRHMRYAFPVYRRHHVEKLSSMLFKAAGLKPNGWLNRAVNPILWTLMQLRIRQLARVVA
jgi:rubrerythrin